MNFIPSRFARCRGSALLTVIFLSAVMAILVGSLLKYTTNERRNNERQRLVLRARNMAENISIYAAEQLTIKLMRLRNMSPRKFMNGSSQIYLPPDNVLTTAYSAPSDMQVRAGLTSSTDLTYIDPATDPTNPNAGLHVNTATIPIVAKATMTQAQVGSITAYCEHTMEVAMIPLFQFGIFYNMDLELFPGQNMTIAGPVHTNGRLIARGEAPGSATLTFQNRVTAAQGLYANGQLKIAYRARDGSTPSDPGGTGAVSFTSSSGTVTNLKNSTTWRDHRWGGSSETATTLNQFKTFATTTYTGYLRTNVHGVTPLELPSIGTYKEKDDPDTPEDDRNNGRQLIEAPNPMKYIGGAWTSTTDDAAIRENKISRKAGLYIVVNPDDTGRFGRLPDGSTVPMLPHSYRCFLNGLNADGTQTIREVVLPGQPAYGYSVGADGISFTTDDKMYENKLPNRYATNTVVGANQVLRIAGPTDTIPLWLPTGTYYENSTATPTLTTFQNAYFYDLRRATNWWGYPYSRASLPYTPRVISKIDFDLTRFKMCFERTRECTMGTIYSTATKSTGYNPDVPSATNWANSIYRSDAVTTTDLKHGLGPAFDVYPTSSTKAAADPFRMYFAPADPTDANITANPSVFGVGKTDLWVNKTGPFWDGIAIYVHSVDAERRADNRIDSGVRLLNGRGPVVSMKTTDAEASTGFTFVTNDALYVMGHFNADGAINATSTSTGNGGFSARYPDSANEKLAALMADAITLLSQPTFVLSGGVYSQVAGWNDGVSGLAADNGGELTRSNSWRTTNPSSSNEVEGEGSGKKASMPYLSVGSGTALTEKLPTVNTEVSAALLTGIVPSKYNAEGLTDGPPGTGTNAQYSGGAHNFPRLLEDWHNQYGSSASSTLSIRGSMVALFESRVAMEPFNLRVYLAPIRLWGLHDGFAQVKHDVPLEPVVINSRRMRYKEMTSAEYASLKTTIEALTD